MLTHFGQAMHSGRQSCSAPTNDCPGVRHVPRARVGLRRGPLLARALLREPQVLIPDEAMSSLDADLERRILQAIDERFARRTVLIVSHRAAAVREAGHVVRLAGGRVFANDSPA